MLEQIKTAQFKNANAEDLCKKVAEYYKDFEVKRKGHIFRGILLAIADVYTEDKALIYTFFKSTRKLVENPNPPKLHRGGRDGAKSKKVSSDCDTCPDVVSGTDPVATKARTIKGTDSKNGMRNKSGTRNQKNKGKQNPEDVFTSIESILERFESNIFAMKAYCQSQGIEFSDRISKAETLAKVILKHYKSS